LRFGPDRGIEMSGMKLTTTDHDRDAAGMKYVYPVVSRRAGGVSLGVNLNPNNACNWRCVYCQVPGLSSGKGPQIDLARLETELRSLLGQMVRGDFMARHVPEGARRLRDVALSGNGEPTSSPQFTEAIEIVGKLLAELELLGSVKLVLLTNGSLIHKPPAEQGLTRMAKLGGEVWFKLDSATAEGARRINSTRLLVRDAVPIRGVMLYGLARPSQQPEAGELSALPREWMERFASRIEETGISVSLSL
jgi:hypothetical protein